MTSATVQRWAGGTARWRPSGEVIDPRRYAVDLIESDRPGLPSCA